MTRPLPRGPHSLTREDVAASQRERLLTAVTALLAEGGWSAVTIGELARRAGVSRGAFYAHFTGKEDCLLAAYDGFAARITEALVTDADDFITGALDGYLRALDADLVAARAFVVAMDAAGPAARARRREAAHGFATLLQSQAPEFPERGWLVIVLGVRELAREILETDPDPRLSDLAPDIRAWIATLTA